MIELHAMRPFFTIFRQETDRACAVLAASLLDDCLQKLLAAAMAVSKDELFKANGPLGTFSAKIDMANAFGLISDEDCRDTHLIRKIRNDFAHSLTHELSFATPAVSQRVSALSLPKLLFESPTLRADRDTPRTRFEIGVGTLYYLYTDVRAKELSQRTAPIAFSTMANSA
jgi:DNA-binding MltR family transcriptional regulator